jgi:glycosyltransferase involved in cell wall biosynthesis
MFPVLEPFGYPFPNAGWIPDFQHLHLPHFFELDEIRQTEMKYRAIARSPLVVLSSRMAQEDFAGLYPERASNGRVLNFVSYADPAYFEDDPIAVQSKYNLPDVFFLVSNQFWAHKNHEIVVDAVAELGRNGVKAVVVCTGNTHDHRAPGFFDQLLERIKVAGISDQFRFLGLIPRIDQMNLMRRSLAVIQPSLFEGWSTVVEDARALGKSLIISDFPVHLEQNPRYSRFFPRNDATALAERMYQAMQTLLPGPDYAAEEEARKDNLESMRIYARNFLAIAAESVGMTK